MKAPRCDLSLRADGAWAYSEDAVSVSTISSNTLEKPETMRSTTGISIFSSALSLGPTRGCHTEFFGVDPLRLSTGWGHFKLCPPSLPDGYPHVRAQVSRFPLTDSTPSTPPRLTACPPVTYFYFYMATACTHLPSQSAEAVHSGEAAVSPSAVASAVHPGAI